MVTEMIERAIEIEGLLRVIRDGNPLPETYRMLKAKVAALAEDVNGLKEDENVKMEPLESQVEIVITNPTVVEEAPEVVFSNEPVVPLPDELDLTEEDDIILTFDEVLPVSHETEETPALEFETTVEPAGYTTTEEKTKTEEPAPAEKIAMPKRDKKLKAAFSLNDRFLYARELFGGDMKMFDSALDFIEGVDDYSVIEDYFFNEMDWDAENPTVQAFMEIIRGKI